MCYLTYHNSVVFSFHVSPSNHPLGPCFLFTCLYIVLYFLSSVSRPQSDIYFVSSAPVSSASNCSSRDTSSQSSPQTPTGYEMPVFPSPLGDGKPRRSVKAPREVDSKSFVIKGFQLSVFSAELCDFGCCQVSLKLEFHLHKLQLEVPTVESCVGF